MRPGSKELTQLISTARGDAIIETDLTYDGLRPVIVRISNRDGRYKVTDVGAAVSAAGDIGRHVAYPEQIPLGRYSVNVSRQGVVWLPAVRPEYAWLERICDLVSRGSVVLYERLLELDDTR
jgi:hypothetical protein